MALYGRGFNPVACHNVILSDSSRNAHIKHNKTMFIASNIFPPFSWLLYLFEIIVSVTKSMLMCFLLPIWSYHLHWVKWLWTIQICVSTNILASSHPAGHGCWTKRTFFGAKVAIKLSLWSVIRNKLLIRYSIHLLMLSIFFWPSGLLTFLPNIPEMWQT